ncbi:MAG: MotA/TolQ/ExbB proton channel family protein [Planctomycetota bacterium]|nr:MAG: MotA/TolQ/ExbB proton channel family protein [Planctomycetota bacterium]
MGLDITAITHYLGNATYIALGLVAIWGAFCVVMVFRRVGQTRFRNEQAQAEFLARLDELLSQGAFDDAIAMCEDDTRAMPQLVRLALMNRKLGVSRLRTLIIERFQRDVLADLEYRLTWVYTVIKTAPMLGLFGTVLGMMGAFSKLSSGAKVDATQLASDISLALITTAMGLAIAIPLVICTANVSVQIRKLEDLVGTGLSRFFESLKYVLPAHGAAGQTPQQAASGQWS